MHRTLHSNCNSLSCIECDMKIKRRKMQHITAVAALSKKDCKRESWVVRWNLRCDVEIFTIPGIPRTSERRPSTEAGRQHGKKIWKHSVFFLFDYFIGQSRMQEEGSHCHSWASTHVVEQSTIADIDYHCVLAILNRWYIFPQLLRL